MPGGIRKRGERARGLQGGGKGGKGGTGGARSSALQRLTDISLDGVNLREHLVEVRVGGLVVHDRHRGGGAGEGEDGERLDHGVGGNVLPEVSADRIRSDPIRSDPIGSNPIRSEMHP